MTNATALAGLTPDLMRHALDLHPLAMSVTRAVRDEDGHAVDMRLIWMNAAARAATPLDAVGELCTAVWPGTKENGVYAGCMHVLDTGETRTGSFDWYDDRSFRPSGYEWSAVRIGAEELLFVMQDVSDQLRASWRTQQTDELTGVARRAHLMSALDSVLSTPAVERTGLLFIDLNGFKAVNDTHGHLAGDLVLAVVGRRLRAAMRSGDLIGRFGGDEFVVIARDVDAAELGRLVERVRSAVAQPLQLSTLASPLRVSASIGAVLARRGDSASSLLGAADAAMYATRRGAVPAQRATG